jgi:hypothetical protein
MAKGQERMAKGQGRMAVFVAIFNLAPSILA